MSLCTALTLIGPRAITGKVRFPKGLLVVCLPLSKSLSVQVKAKRGSVLVLWYFLSSRSCLVVYLLLLDQVNNWFFFSIIDKNRSIRKVGCFYEWNYGRNCDQNSWRIPLPSAPLTNFFFEKLRTYQKWNVVKVKIEGVDSIFFVMFQLFRSKSRRQQNSERIWFLPSEFFLNSDVNEESSEYTASTN